MFEMENESTFRKTENSVLRHLLASHKMTCYNDTRYKIWFIRQSIRKLLREYTINTKTREEYEKCVEL